MTNHCKHAVVATLAWLPVLAHAGGSVPIGKVPVPGVPGVLGLLAVGGVAAVVAYRNRRK